MEYKIKYYVPNELFDNEFVTRELIERQTIEVFLKSLPISKLRALFHITIDSDKGGIIVDTWL